MEEQVEQSGVEVAEEAALQPETENPQIEVESGVEEQAEAGPDDKAPDANTAWEKRISAIKQKTEQELRNTLEKEYSEKASRYQQMLDRTAKFYGFENHEDYMAALEQAEMDKRIQEEAEKLGVDEEVIRNHLQPLNQKVSDYERQLNELKEAEALRQVENQLASMERDAEKFPDFAKYKNDVINIAATRGYTLEDAYKIATYEERVNNARLQAQQEAVRNLQKNADSATGSLGADSPEPQGGYAGMSAAERKAFREAVKAGKQPTF